MDHKQFKAIREGLRLTQADLAKELDLSWATVQRYDSGTCPIPKAVQGYMLYLQDRRAWRCVIKTLDGQLLEATNEVLDRVRNWQVWGKFESSRVMVYEQHKPFSIDDLPAGGATLSNSQYDNKGFDELFPGVDPKTWALP